MPFPTFSPRRLTGAAALACAAALMPMTSLVATASPAAAAAATGPPAVPASFQPASASFVSPASGYVWPCHSELAPPSSLIWLHRGAGGAG
jgi:hypothetical protein